MTLHETCEKLGCQNTARLADQKRDAEHIAAEREKQIWGFYEEKYPTYTNYSKANELSSLVTPEEVNGLIHKLKTAVEALTGIANANPDAPEVESWKWLARRLMGDAQNALEEIGVNLE